MNTSGKRLALAISAVALLTACGNDESVERNRNAFKSVINQITNRQQAPQRVTQEQIAQVLSTTAEPVYLIEVETAKTSALFTRIAQNGAVSTYGTRARQSFSVENGVLRGTRAFGDDLMSTELDALRLSLSSGEATSGQRVMRYLNGASERVEITFNCTYSGGSEVIESCSEVGGSRTFSNSYSRDDHGNVYASRQWVSPLVGYMRFKRLQ